MKKLTLLLLLMVSTNVFAEWAEVGSNDEMNVYNDFSSIKKQVNKTKMWSMFDFKTVKTIENDSFLSQVFHYEYDCINETIKQLDFIWYSGNMKSGDVVYSQRNMNIEPISVTPESINEHLFKIACDKK